MSGAAMDSLDLMVREGPCIHCGIDRTPLWRSGPPEKPVLCNACGSRWKTRGTLEDYMPKHATKDNQSSQPKLFSLLNPTSSGFQHATMEAQSGQSILFQKLNPTTSAAAIHGVEKAKLFGSYVVGHNNPSFVFGSNVVGHGQSPFVFGAGTNYRSSSGIAVSGNSSKKQNVEAPLWDSKNVARKKRSTLEQRVLSPAERLHEQLYIAMEEHDDNEDPESVLIFERINKYIPENEIGLGCMLLKPLTSTTKDFKPESAVGVKTTAVSPPAEDSKLPIESASVLIYSPIGESSEDDTSVPRSKSLEANTESTREPGITSPQHHMITRSRAKSREAHGLYRDIDSSDLSGEDEDQNLNRRCQVASPYKRTRGRSHRSQVAGQGTGNSMFPQNESKIDRLTKDLNEKLNCIGSVLTDDFVFTANSEFGNPALDDL